MDSTTTTRARRAMAASAESTAPALSVADARLLLRSKDALTTLARKKDALGALAERLYPDAANPTHSLAHDLFPDTFGPPDDYRPPLSPRLDDDDGASLDEDVGSAAAADGDGEDEEEDEDGEGRGEEADEEVYSMSAKARAKRKAVEPNPAPTGAWPRVAAEDLTEEERERRRKKRQRNLAVKRLDIQSQADRLAKLLALGEVPKVRPYGKEGFMSLSVTHEVRPPFTLRRRTHERAQMFAIDEAYAPLSSPNPKPVSSNPVWSSFAAAYLLPTVSAFLACPTPWSDYAATLHACERTVYWSKFCEGGGPGNEKERAARRRHNGIGGGAEDGELPGLGKEWGLGCAEMATVQARRMVEWPFDPRKTSVRPSSLAPQLYAQRAVRTAPGSCRLARSSRSCSAGPARRLRSSSGPTSPAN